MAKKWIALNILLLVVAVGLARELYYQFEAENDSDKIESVSVERQEAAKAASGVSADTLMRKPTGSNIDYSIISGRTLFSDLRGGEEIAPPVVPPKITPLNPKPVLVGTSMIDGRYTASVISPPAAGQARAGQLAPEIWSVGQEFRGYTVASISADQMVMENSGVSEIIPINRTARRQQPTARPATTAPRVVSIGPGGGASGAVTVTTASSTPQVTRIPTVVQPAGVQQGRPQQGKPAPSSQVATISTPDGDVVTLTLPENVQSMLTGLTNVQQGGGAAAKVSAKAPKSKAQPVQSQGDIQQLLQLQQQQLQQQQQQLQQQQLQQQQLQQLQQVIMSPFGEIVRPGSE